MLPSLLSFHDQLRLTIIADLLVGLCFLFVIRTSHISFKLQLSFAIFFSALDLLVYDDLLDHLTLLLVCYRPFFFCLLRTALRCERLGADHKVFLPLLELLRWCALSKP